MEIKTLAQILEESSDSPKQSKTRRKSESNNKQQKHRNKKSTSWADRASSHGSVMPDSFVQSDEAENTETTKSAETSKAISNSENSDNSQTRADAFKQYKSEREDADNNLFFEKHITSSLDTSSNTDYQPNNQGASDPSIRKKRKKKQFHPASPYKPKIEKAEPVKEVDPNSIKNLLSQVRSENEQETNMQAGIDSETCDITIDNLPSALKAYLKTPEQRQAEKEEIKANSRLRWLAFYYLSRREHSAGELRQKLIDKEQDPQKIDELLEEFAEKGYQSDYRTALMLIREGIRKGRGRVRIKNDFYKRKVDMPTNIDELIDMATEDNEEFADVMSNNELVEGVDWLRIAVEARVKKYGEEIPTDQKMKARQLRFLQYRGFKPDICFQALNHNLETLDDRF